MGLSCFTAGTEILPISFGNALGNRLLFWVLFKFTNGGTKSFQFIFVNFEVRQINNDVNYALPSIFLILIVEKKLEFQDEKKRKKPKKNNARWGNHTSCLRSMVRI